MIILTCSLVPTSKCTAYWDRALNKERTVAHWVVHMMLGVCRAQSDCTRWDAQLLKMTHSVRSWPNENKVLKSAPPLSSANSRKARTLHAFLCIYILIVAICDRPTKASTFLSSVLAAHVPSETASLLSMITPSMVSSPVFAESSVASMHCALDAQILFELEEVGIHDCIGSDRCF